MANDLDAVIFRSTARKFSAYLFMRNLLWNSLRSASAILASSAALHCNSKRSSDSDSDVRARHMGQVIRAQHDRASSASCLSAAAVAAVVAGLERR